MSRPPIRVATVVLRNAHGQLLVVCKHGSTIFHLPGGKPEAGETPAQAAVREVAEELGLRLDPEQLQLIGSGQAQAANEPGRRVEGTFFTHPALSELRDPIGTGDAAELAPHAELAELRWADPDPDDPSLAALLREVMLPLLQRAHRS